MPLKPPAELRTREFILRPIAEADAALDHEAVMASRDFLLPWEQSGWPEEGFTVEANRDDIRRMVQRAADGDGFTYTMLEPSLRQCLGCVYVMSTGARLYQKAQVAPLGASAWAQHPAAVYFWVRTERIADGLDGRLLDELDRWFRDEWRMGDWLFLTNEGVPQQRALLQGRGLAPRFTLAYAGKPSKELAYA